MIEAIDYTGDGIDAACVTVVRQETRHAGREVVIGPALYGVATWAHGPATLRKLSQDLADAATWLEASRS
ncbi:MAG: hypothetical protein ACRDTZ_07305 [Pseudonocardiaceae bacterium]